MSRGLTRVLLSLLVPFMSFIFIHEAHAQQEPEKKSQGINVIVTQSPKIIVKVVSVKNNNCYGESKGAVDITATGGYPPYKYYWAHGDTTQDIAGLRAGKYRVAVYDDFSCSDTVEVEVTEPVVLDAQIVSIKDILCYGYNNGEVDINVTGGTPPYNYSWNNGAQSQDIKGVHSGRYSVLITDANNCQEIVTADVAEKPLIVRSLDDIENIKCNGDSTGMVNISVEGGVPPYSYKWNNGASTQDLSMVPAGTYEVVVSDAEGCTEVSSTKVKEPAALSISIDEIRNLRCYGDLGGAINIGVTGGTQPFKYTWSNGAITQDIAGIGAGTYKVDVVDKNNCANSLSTEVTQPAELTATVVESKDVSYYGGEDGAINIEVSGGVGTYKYRWNNDATTQDISGLKTGAYSVRITDESGCTKIMNLSLAQPAPLVAKLESTENIKCNGDESGSVNILVTGGVPPYNYKWSNGATTEDISNLPAGEYSVEVTDANNHKQVVEALLIEPEPFKASVAQVTNILCNSNYTGAIDIDVSGGIEPYKYRWSNGKVTQDLKDVPAGSYSVKITDANLCEQNVDAEITQPENLTLDFEQITHINCNSDSTGAISINVAGGVEPYKYTWSNNATTKNLTGLKAGNYSVKVTDNNGCFREISTELTQPEMLVIIEGATENVDCYNNSTGSIALNVFGGVKPYVFAWSNGATTKDIENLTAGAYSFKVTDNQGCVKTIEKAITQPTLLERSLVSVQNIECFGDAKGSIDIDVKGGVQPYRYRWNNGAITQDLNNVGAGKYTVVIEDANRCMDTLTATINQNNLINATVEITNIKCNGENTGIVDLTVVGGVAPYKYAWSNQATTQDVSKLGAGVYSVTVTDARGCFKSVDAQITEPPRFVASLEAEKNILCNSESTGSIAIRASGGVSPYKFQWSNGATTQNLNGIPAGEYTLTASDENGCLQAVSTIITEPTAIQHSIKAINNVLCYGDKGGAIDIQVAGGVGPYKYKWSNGDTTQDIQGLAAGKYMVQLADANGCVKSLEAEVTQPSLLSLKLDTVVHILCNGESKGRIDLSVTGGVQPYAYSWSNGAKTQDIANVPAGSYTVTVTDAQGCIQTISSNINQPEPLVAKLGDIKHIKCNGETDGAIFVEVAGGVKPYVFKWSNGNTAQNLVDVGAGNYSVQIVDKNGCSQSLTAEITQPEKLVSSLTETKNVSCYEGTDGEVNITVIGGSTPYKYSWSNGSNLQDLIGVSQGNYSVKIMDSKGCRDSIMNVRIEQPTYLDVKIANVSNILLFGDKSGAIDLTVSGGVPPYKYSWSNGATTQNVAKLPGGNYSVLVVDANGCEKTVNASIIQPPPLAVRLAAVEDIVCNSNETGSISIDVTGGAPPYNFEWSNGMNTEDISGVPAGDYTVKVTDVNGNSKTLNAKITEPTALNIQQDMLSHLSCFEDKTGAISVSVSGGVTPYSYSWSSGATSQDISGLAAGDYTLTVTDANKCAKTLNATVEQPALFEASIAEVTHINCMGEPMGEVVLDVKGGVTPYAFSWNNGEKSKDLSGVTAGNYSVNITDANNCKNQLEVMVNEPTELIATINRVSNNLCSGEEKGSIEINVKGGTTPYNFAWSNGGNEQNLTGVRSGEYSVTITDDKGCSKMLDAIITEPTLLASSIISVQNVKCYGDQTGEVLVAVEGGTKPYAFDWNGSIKDQNLRNVPAGDYLLNVTDNNGCVSTLSTKVVQPELLSLKLDTVHNILCNGENKGFVDITVEGGVYPYKYDWSNGWDSEDLVNVVAGSYSVKVQDMNGCMENITASISQPSNLTVTLDSLSNIQCSGDETGMISITANGGVGPYDYSWSNGQNAKSIRNIPAGNYKATVIDGNGCSTIFTADVTEPPALVKTVDAITDIRCYGDSTGSIYVTVMEGTAPYSFRWSNGETTEDLRGVKAGNYQLRITEGNNCVSVLEATIEEPAVFLASAAGVSDVECFGDETGSVNISVTGGVEPYRFSWSNGAETQNISDVGADSYSVMITDANGCIKTVNADVVEPPRLTLTIDSVKNVKCCGDNSGAIYISVVGGVEPYSYLWSHGETTQDVENLVLGVYTVNVTDANNCMISTADDMTLYEQVVSKGRFTTRDILFDVGKSTIKPESFTTINKIATFMKEHPDIAFRIDGHTDSDGTAESNQQLSEDRANAIMSALIKFGIRPSRLEAQGYGESRPVATNATQEGKALNRRVEFVVMTGTLDGTLIESERNDLQEEE